MRRVVLLSAVAAALVFTIGCGGEADTVSLTTPPPPEPVPLTITMPPESDPGPVDSVRVSWEGADDPVAYGRGDGRTQYLVGQVPPDPDDSYRFKFQVEYWLGGPNPQPNPPQVSFEAESSCQGGETEGTIDRIACAVVQQGGEKLICAATYDHMNDPPQTCVGTYACIKCPGGVRVCSSNPECAN